MNPSTAEFLSLIDRHLERGVERPVPEYTKLVTNKAGYAYFSHFGKVDVMNYSTAIFLINDEVRALYVIYSPDPQGTGTQKEQRYLVKSFDQSIEVGDYVVVPSTVGHKLSIAKVTDVHADIDFDSTTIVPWVVQRIEPAGFNDIIRQEEIAVAKIKEADVMAKKRTLAQRLMDATQIDLRLLPLASKKRGIDD